MAHNIVTLYHSFRNLNWGQKLMIVVSILLSAAIVFRLLTPEVVPVQTAVLQNVSNGPVSLNNIEFRGNSPNVPTQMPVATAEYVDISEQLLQNLLSAFSIPTKETADGIWQGPEYEIIEISEPHLYSLTKTAATEGLSPLAEINPQRAVTEANKIIDGLYGSGPKPVAVLSEIEVLNDEESFIDSPETAQFIRIPYAFTIENIPVLIEQDTVYPAEIILDSSYVLSKATFSPYTLEIDTNKNYKTIGTQEAIGRVNQNNAAVVFYAYFGPNAADFSSITSGVMNEATVQYRLDLSNNTLVPYYNFSGVIKNSAGYDIETEIITPALKTDF